MQRSRWGVGCVVVAVLAVMAPAPADAHIDACAGKGTLTTTAPMYLAHTTYPVTGTGFTLDLDLGGCPMATFTAVGTLSGYCNFGVGAGVAGHHPFVLTMTPAFVVQLDGKALGAFTLVPDSTRGSNCASIGVGATHFLVAGAVVLTDVP